jgi:hypothetical protein
MQSTQPQTIGYSLADSPVGLLAWIYEKLISITDGYQWTDDEGAHARSSSLGPRLLIREVLLVLTWISIYWFSRAGPTSAGRIYYEYRAAIQQVANIVIDATLPVGFSHFPKEVIRAPRT